MHKYIYALKYGGIYWGYSKAKPKCNKLSSICEMEIKNSDLGYYFYVEDGDNFKIIEKYNMDPEKYPNAISISIKEINEETKEKAKNKFKLFKKSNKK